MASSPSNPLNEGSGDDEKAVKKHRNTSEQLILGPNLKTNLAEISGSSNSNILPTFKILNSAVGHHLLVPCGDQSKTPKILFDGSVNEDLIVFNIPEWQDFIKAVNVFTFLLDYPLNFDNSQPAVSAQLLSNNSIKNISGFQFYHQLRMTEIEVTETGNNDSTKITSSWIIMDLSGDIGHINKRVLLLPDAEILPELIKVKCAYLTLRFDIVEIDNATKPRLIKNLAMVVILIGHLKECHYSQQQQSDKEVTGISSFERIQDETFLKKTCFLKDSLIFERCALTPCNLSNRSLRIGIETKSDDCVNNLGKYCNNKEDSPLVETLIFYPLNRTELMDGNVKIGKSKTKNSGPSSNIIVIVICVVLVVLILFALGAVTTVVLCRKSYVKNIHRRRHLFRIKKYGKEGETTCLRSLGDWENLPQTTNWKLLYPDYMENEEDDGGYEFDKDVRTPSPTNSLRSTRSACFNHKSYHQYISTGEKKIFDESNKIRKWRSKSSIGHAIIIVDEDTCFIENSDIMVLEPLVCESELIFDDI